MLAVVQPEPVQFAGVSVEPVPRARQCTTQAVPTLLDATSTSFQDPQPDLGRGAGEERHVHAEGVIVASLRAAVADQFDEPMLSGGCDPVHAPRSTTPTTRAGGVGLLLDQPGAQQPAQRWVQSSTRQRAEGAERVVQPFPQLVAVHRGLMQKPEHGEFEHLHLLRPSPDARYRHVNTPATLRRSSPPRGLYRADISGDTIDRVPRWPSSLLVAVGGGACPERRMEEPWSTRTLWSCGPNGKWSTMRCSAERCSRKSTLAGSG